MEKKQKRITMKLKCPNPLFEKWLIEWRDQAKENNSRMQHCFGIALKSLQKYPLPLETGKDCKILHGFGDTLCNMLDEKLIKYQDENQQPNNNYNKTEQQIQPKISNQKSPSLNRRKCDEYIPQHGSGGYAILITLYQKSLETNSTETLTKLEIIEKARYLSKKSFTKPDPGSYYTAWSSMKTLIENDLVKKYGKPAKFSLTTKGVTVADKLYVQHTIEELENRNDMVEGAVKTNEKFEQSSSSSSTVHNVDKSRDRLLAQPSTSSSSSSNHEESVIFAPNSFRIILIVDNNEISGKKSDSNDEFLFELQKLKIQYDVRNLKVGDYIWICRNNDNIDLVLPYIIERKRFDDFASSIKDGRFHEQKFRLKQSGIQNRIYLVENYGRNQAVGLPISSIYQAAINTAVQDGFMIKFTKNYQETAEYLSSLTRLIIKHYKSKTIASCDKENLTTISIDDDLISLMKFEHFNKSAVKTKQFKIKDLFVRQLLQIKGLSVDKALAIVEQYSTPKCLKMAYDNTPIEQREKLLSTIKYGNLRKNLGVVLSKTVYQLFCNKSF